MEKAWLLINEAGVATRMFLVLLSWIAILGEVVFGIFSLAAGLYYLAELIEEYSVIAKKVITVLVLFVIACHILLLFDGFPWGLIIAGLLCHICYGSLMSTFPVIRICSIGFLGGCFFLLISHILAFQYFTEEWFPFQEVIGFFFLCEWLVPFALFISLSANDLALPTVHPSSADDQGISKNRRSGFLALVDILSQTLSDFTPSRTSKRY